ncbi:MAG: hypothetical protein ACYDAQ_18645, partial [Mycobacteriales bacterium]
MSDLPYSPPPGVDPATPPAADRLSQLLSRAVEDQVSEQRALYTALDEVRAALASLEGLSTSEVRSTIDFALSGAVGRIDADLRASTAALAARLDALSQRLESALEDAARPAVGPAAIQDMVDGMAGMRTDLRSLPEQLGHGVAAALASGLGDIRQQMNALAESVAQAGHLEALVGAVRQDVEDLRTEVSQFAAVSPVAEELRSMRRDLDQLRGALAERAAGSEQIEAVVREGVRDAVRDFVRDTLREAVREVVTLTTHDSELRMAAHVDEAVLALAEALLRRRPAALTAAPAAVVSPAPRAAVSAEPRAAVSTEPPAAVSTEPPAAVSTEPFVAHIVE